MNVYRLVWEDAEKNRDVEIHVNYLLTDGAVQIDKLTPTKVTLYDENRSVVKVLPVTRPTGQRVLAQAFENRPASGERLEDQIREQHLAV